MKINYLKLGMIALFLIALPFSLFAQNKQDLLRNRAAQKVGQMCDYIEFMANPENDLETRSYYCDKALNLFINRGNAYEEDGIMKEGVLMEVSSVNRKSKLPKLMKKYFIGLMNLKYQKVVIESTDVSEIEVSNLREVDNYYVCTCYFEQAFCGYRDGRPVYRDITRKKVKCYIYVEQTERGEEYIVMLGDTTVTETRPA